MRRAAKVDDNQEAIVEALRGVGASVLSLHQLGKGVPDILAFFRGSYFLLEVKDGSKPASRQKLTPLQKSWHATWRGPVSVVRTPREALVAIGALLSTAMEE